MARLLRQIQFGCLLVNGALEIFGHADAVVIVQRDVGSNQIGTGVTAFGAIAVAIAAGLVVRGAVPRS